MGWWRSDEEGHSLLLEGELVWGDWPADEMDKALDEIEKAFEEGQGRRPTLDELKAGLLFSATPRYEEE